MKFKFPQMKTSITYHKKIIIKMLTPITQPVWNACALCAAPYCQSGLWCLNTLRLKVRHLLY